MARERQEKGIAVTFIEVIPDAAASGDVEKMYDGDRRTFGFVPNFTRAFSLRPEVYAAWRQLNGAVKANMDPRRYELATLAAAGRLRSSYCALAHGSVLIENFLSPEAIPAVMADYRSADLEPVEVAVMSLADKVAHDATSVTQEDIEGLRQLGLSDGEITDVILAAAARSFFSKALDALGAAPDAKYAELDPAIRESLTVGRAIDGVDAAPIKP
jgi:uncharacterized peroxidase-related enzyme